MLASLAVALATVATLLAVTAPGTDTTAGADEVAGSAASGPTGVSGTAAPTRRGVGARVVSDGSGLRPAPALEPLTPEGSDRYEFAPGEQSMVVRAPASNRGGNLRQVWWPAGARAGRDQQACVTWTSFGGPLVQAGVALRVRRSGDELQALTVTNNVWSGARAGWNVHAWRRSDGQARLVGQVVLAEAFGRSLFDQPPLPWRVCARVVGATFEFKVWSLARGDTEPAWGDPGHGAGFLLSREWVYPGRAGWYVGHLRAGEETALRALRSWDLDLPAGAALAVHARAAGGEAIRSVIVLVDGDRLPAPSAGPEMAAPHPSPGG